MSTAKSLSIQNSIEFLIRIEKGPGAGKVYRIFPPKVTIGRDASSQIVTTDPKASRNQCSILIKDDVILKDNSSKGTTLINGQSFKEQALKPGDVISFGDTKIQFMVKPAEKNKSNPQLAGIATPGTNKKNTKPGIRILFGVIILLAAGLFFTEDPVKTVEEQLATRAELDKQIEASQQKQTEIKDIAKSKRKLKKKRYLFSVDQHFIAGFRDLQNGQFGRAIDSFGTVLASDSSHQKAQQYSRIAKKKRMDLIDTHMSDGIKYKQKIMYDRCIAEFEKAKVLINNKKTQKYRIAKTQLEECRVLKSGGF